MVTSQNVYSDPKRLIVDNNNVPKKSAKNAYLKKPIFGFCLKSQTSLK